MPQYVAFLRAIYGEKMAPLRHSFETMGFSNVASFIASGNLIFEAMSRDAAALEAQIEETLPDTIGYEVATFVRLADEVKEVAAYKPFDEAELEAEGNTLYAGFLKEAPGDEARRELMTHQTENDALHIDEREVYWLCRTSSSESSLSGTIIERVLDGSVTTRNIRTVRRIAAKYL